MCAVAAVLALLLAPVVDPAAVGAPERRPDEDALSSQDRVACIAFVDDHTLAAACGMRVGLWDMATGRQSGWLQHGEFNQYTSITGIAIPSNRQYLVSAANDGRLVIWNTAAKKQVRVIHPPWVNDWMVGRGKRLKGEQELIDLFQVPPPFTPVGFSSVAVSDDGEVVAAGLDDGTVHLWKIGTGEYLGGLAKGRAEKVDYAVDEVITDPKLRRWWRSHYSPSTISVWTMERKSSVYRIQFHSDGKLVLASVVVYQGRSVRAWDIETRTEQFLLPDYDRFLVEPGGRSGVGTDFESKDVRTYIHSLHGDGKRRLLAADYKAGAMFSFSKEGKYLASYGGDRRARVWEVESARLIGEFPKDEPGSPLRAVAISPDGKLLAAAWDDDGIRVWNIADRSEKHRRDADGAPQ